MSHTASNNPADDNLDLHIDTNNRIIKVETQALDELAIQLSKLGLWESQKYNQFWKLLLIAGAR